MDRNPFLDKTAPGARGTVERLQNIAWQTRAAAPTDYENRLGDALERAFANGVEALPQLVAALNAEGCRDPAGQAWTEASFQAEMRRLGA